MTDAQPQARQTHPEAAPVPGKPARGLLSAAGGGPGGPRGLTALGPATPHPTQLWKITPRPRGDQEPADPRPGVQSRQQWGRAVQTSSCALAPLLREGCTHPRPASPGGQTQRTAPRASHEVAHPRPSPQAVLSPASPSACLTAKATFGRPEGPPLGVGTLGPWL